jgi:hypothetical protein
MAGSMEQICVPDVLWTRCLAMAIPRLFVAADMCVNFVAGCCLAIDVRADSAIQAFSRHDTIYIYNRNGLW